MFDLMNVLKKLDRKIFHSEADFQFNLAWKIKEEYSDAEIRLEIPIKINDKVCFIDILVMYEDKYFPIELKYKTRALSKDLLVSEEVFSLKDQGARNLLYYDFLSDLERIEHLVNTKEKFERGYVVLLTNDSSYFTTKQLDYTTNHYEFSWRLDNKIKKGIKSWKNIDSSTAKGRPKTIEIQSDYDLNWQHFSNITESKRNSEFKFSCLMKLKI